MLFESLFELVVRPLFSEGLKVELLEFMCTEVVDALTAAAAVATPAKVAAAVAGGELTELDAPPTDAVDASLDTVDESSWAGS